MPRTRRLLNDEITFSVAKEREVNILHQLDYHDKQTRFFSHLNSKHAWMKAVVVHHLGLRSTEVCQVAETKDWLCGSFNVSVPVTIQDWKRRQQQGHSVLLRFPLPHRVGEAGDEKIQCEAGAYAWLQANCPGVPIPQLYGFATSTGETFTHVENLPFLSRYFQHLRRRLLSWFGLPVPSCYVRHSNRTLASFEGVTGAGYLLIEKIEEPRGTMLSNTWSLKRHDTKLRQNFFRDLSRILLSISSIPFPQIGSFVIDSKGFLRLSNRPLSIEIVDLENEQITTDMPRHYTYSTVDSYVADILRVHDSRLRDQPNAVNNLEDCAYQMSALAAIRTTSPNIFVDENWHITCLVDLEWACSRPIEMVEPPYWLTNKGVDEIDPKDYDTLRRELMSILASEETKLLSSVTSPDTDHTVPRLSEVMEEAWTRGTFWYTLALSSPTGLFRIFYEHIQPLLSEHCSEEIGEIMPFYWVRDVGKFVARKVSDKKKYDSDLQRAFEED